MSAASAIVHGEAEAVQRIVERYRRPSEDAGQAFRDGLRSGEVKAVWVRPGGERMVASPQDFTDDAFDDAVLGPPMLINNGEPGGGFSIAIVRSTLEINAVSLFRFCDAVFGRPPEREEPAPAAAPPRNARRAGRPRLHEWDRLAIAIGCRIVACGLPASPGVLLDEAKTWFVDTTGEIPDDKDLRGFIAQVWPDFAKAHLEGMCDLRPAEGGAK